MTELKNIFDIYKGKSYFKDFEEDLSSQINYVTTSGMNQGVKTQVKENKRYQLFEPGTLTVALQGTVLSTFIQSKPFYLQTHVAALAPKEKLAFNELFYYAIFINKYKDKYSYGRKANSTIQNLLVPEKHEIPSWVYEIEIPDYSDAVEPKEDKVVGLPSSDNWKEFLFPEVFEMIRGKGTSAGEAKNNPGTHPYIGASAYNNGITIFTDNTPTHSGNSITISTDGSVGQSFYQKEDFSATSNIIVVTLKNKELNPFIALFLTTLIKQIGESFDYGRKWGITRMRKSKISLPVDSNEDPDWQLMEDYIKSLPYSKYL